MGYAQELTLLRNAIQDAVRVRDGALAQKKSLEYVQVLKKMLNCTQDVSKKQVLHAEISKYERIAAMSQSLHAPALINEDEWVTKLFEKYLPATLVIETDSASATGFFITNDGWALTNYHVINNAEAINVYTGDGNISATAKVVAVEKQRDVALLKVDVSVETEYIRLIDDYAMVKPGSAVMVIGNALAYGLAPICGTVKFSHEKTKGDLLYTAPSNVGDSGAPAINRQGVCIGINKSATTAIVEEGKKIGTYGLTHATPADELKLFLNEWSKKYKFSIQ